MSEIDDYNRKVLDFAKEVSIPEYRNFCISKDLHFHFWDTIEKEKYNAAVANEELRLHWQARILFNKTKDEYIIHNDKYIEWYLDSFLEPVISDELNMHQLSYKHEKLKREFDEYKQKREIKDVVIIAIAALFIITGVLRFSTFIFHDFFNFFFIILLVIAGLLPSMIYERLTRRNIKIKEMKIEKELSLIRKELHDINFRLYR